MGWRVGLGRKLDPHLWTLGLRPESFWTLYPIAAFLTSFPHVWVAGVPAHPGLPCQAPPSATPSQSGSHWTVALHVY